MNQESEAEIEDEAELDIDDGIPAETESELEIEDRSPTRRLQLNVDDLDAANTDGSADQLIDFFSLFEIHFVAGEDSSIDNERIIRWELVDIAD